MQLHPRTMIVKAAQLELSGFMLDWQQKHDLTFGETFKILAEMMERDAKYMIRQERHPDDPDARGDEA